MSKVYEIEETLSQGLKYTEETSRTVRSIRVWDCFLWQEGIEEPVSGLNVVPFRQRFGAVAVPAEGIGGVETQPEFRRRGYIGTLMTRVLESISRRVTVVFLADSIDFLYDKYGFVNCLAESYLSLRVNDVERAAKQIPPGPTYQVRGFSTDDLPDMVRLYNQAHSNRPWTHERHAGWNRLYATETWRPGSMAIILEEKGRVAGYAVFREPEFGFTPDSFVIDEFTARDGTAAQALLIDIARRCWEMHLREFRVREPLDSLVGLVAQRVGCVHHQTYPPGGGMMGKILDRQRLLSMIESELKRRLYNTELIDAHPAAFDALLGGKIITDDRMLLKLLVGHWSMIQARSAGTTVPEQFERVLNAWFPGGATPFLAQPYAHFLDRY